MRISTAVTGSCLAIALSVHVAATRQPAARDVDRTQLMRDVTTLAGRDFEGRRAGTRGGLRARQWIAERFAAAGLRPAGTGGYLQTFDAPAKAEYQAANVIGRVTGLRPEGRTIVVTAHYDHLGVRNGVLYPGADDNASGVAVLLASARRFTTRPPEHTLVFAALDAEESGQRGARALLASDVLPRSTVALNINVDMVSRSDRNEMYAAGTYYFPWQIPILDDVQKRVSVKIRYGHDRPAHLGGGLEDWTHSSDHGPFHDAGIPFVYFGVEDHPDYHKPTDTADRIDPRFFGDAADAIVEAIQTFDARLP